ncbi:hypothetical protein M3Y98_01144700 [Aphelenchoides besseyi]|nr:hypothetical protein M3Y98_01144700 [Aphelenchoides besseyi]KAI6210720.1 hypothetical protein M3Y96_00357900 [Aphelenchoides besseyi]
MNFKLISWLVLLGISNVVRGHKAVTSTGRLSCSATKLCGEYDREIWLKRRNDARKLVSEKELRIEELENASLEVTESGAELDGKNESFDQENQHYYAILALLDDYCSDRQTAGFLLNNNSDHWPLACVWTASDVNGTCIPARPSKHVFDYVDAEEWRKSVHDFRVAIGCSFDQVQLFNQVNELYICREHCTQAGISYFFSLFIMVSIVMTIGVLCF